MSGRALHDVVIVGGGPAGASAACLLARSGIRPLLLERETGPRHKICGEFLSVEAQDYLAALNVDPKALGGAPIRRVRLVHGRQLAEAPLPFEGIGLTRRVLDEALLRQAAASGAALRRGHVVRSVTHEGGQLGVRLRGDEVLRARTVFLANGKHDLHDPKRPPAPGGGGLIGFKTYYRLAPRQAADLGDAIEILLFGGGYAGLQSVEGGIANLCLLVRRDLFERAGKGWDALLCRLCEINPHLGSRLTGAEAVLDKPLSISNVPYGFVHRPVAGEPEGLFRLGDQMGVIQSFSGDGMAIALHTAHVAASAFREHGNAAARFHHRVGREIGGQIRLASTLYDLSRHPLGRFALLSACRLSPGLLGSLASWTRVSPTALRRAGAATRPAQAA